MIKDMEDLPECNLPNQQTFQEKKKKNPKMMNGKNLSTTLNKT